MGRSLAGCCLGLVAGCAFGFGLDYDDEVDAPIPGVDSAGSADSAGSPSDGAPVPDVEVPDAPPIDAPPCVAGDARVVNPATGHCYTHHLGTLSWNNAHAACLGLGPATHLAVVESQAENDVIFSIVGTRRTWMGADDAATEGVWLWTTGTPWVFTHWRPGEPGNGGGGVPGEDCLEMAAISNGEWNDNECYVAAAYVCERD